MSMLMEGEINHPTEPYLDILSEEPGFDGSLVIFDALRWTLIEGG